MSKERQFHGLSAKQLYLKMNNLVKRYKVDGNISYANLNDKDFREGVEFLKENYSEKAADKIMKKYLKNEFLRGEEEAENSKSKQSLISTLSKEIHDTTKNKIQGIKENPGHHSYLVNLAKVSLERAKENSNVDLFLKANELYNLLGVERKRDIYIVGKKILSSEKNNQWASQDDIEKLENFLQKNKPGPLEGILKLIPFVFIFLGIFFLSPNLTGNVIGNMARSSGNILGGVLFILGIVGAFFTFRK